ncbi:hypothetical protein ACN4EK_04220 [Pantanalinema rosaneae CENA516]|uniref:hypothetical protein n=1 Tax=Pantanalinema rosaneae TaxID=1620701 RepID=UPI003D6E8D0D
MKRIHQCRWLLPVLSGIIVGLGVSVPAIAKTQLSAGIPANLRSTLQCHNIRSIQYRQLEQVVAQFGRGLPDFFEQGDRQFEREIDRLNQPQTDPNLTIQSTGEQWRPIVSQAGKFSIWLPPGVMSEETKTLAIAAKSMTFNVVASQAEGSRFVVAYGDLPANQPLSDQAVFAAIRDEVVAQTQFKVVSENPITFGQWTGQEWQLSQANETIIYRVYRVQQRVYLLAAKQTGKIANQSNSVDTFFRSFKLL